MGEARRRAARGEMPYQQKVGHHDRDVSVRQLAREMDERVRQLTNAQPSISDRDLMEQMVGFLPNLHHLWTTTSDDTLANLCGEFRGFYRYALVMENAFDEQRKNPNAVQFGPDVQPLPMSVRPAVAQLMSEAATLEREMQNLADAIERYVAMGRHVNLDSFQADLSRAADIASRHRRWVSGLHQLVGDVQAAGAAPASAQLLAKTFADINDRIGLLSERMATVATAGRAAAGRPEAAQ